MKILLTVHQFFPEFYAGTEVLTFEVAKELLRRGHQVTVFAGYPRDTALSDADAFDEYVIEGISVHRYHHAYERKEGQSSVVEQQYDNPAAIEYFSELMADVKPDLVHFFHLSRLSTGLIDVVKAHGIAGFITLTDFWMICPTSQLLLNSGRCCDGPLPYAGNCAKHMAQRNQFKDIADLVDRVPDRIFDLAVLLAQPLGWIPSPLIGDIRALAKRKAVNVERLNALNRIISPTTLMTKTMIENGVSEDRIVQRSYGISVSGFEASKARKRADRDLVVGFIGSLSPHKGCHVLIEAFSGLPEAASAQLKIYGNGDEFPDYMAALRASAQGQTAIAFCGVFPNAQIAQVLADIDVLVVPSVWFENAPLVVYSAIAAKCPVIASDYPGLSEVIHHGENGLLFESGNSQALQSHIEQLIHSPDLLDQLSANCRPPKSVRNHVDELLQIYAAEISVDSVITG